MSARGSPGVYAPEIQFDTLDQLKSQITKDIENTRRYFEPEQGGIDHDALHGTK